MRGRQLDIDHALHAMKRLGGEVSIDKLLLELRSQFFSQGEYFRLIPGSTETYFARDFRKLLGDLLRPSGYAETTRTGIRISKAGLTYLRLFPNGARPKINDPGPTQ